MGPVAAAFDVDVACLVPNFVLNALNMLLAIAQALIPNITMFNQGQVQKTPPTVN